MFKLEKEDDCPSFIEEEKDQAIFNIEDAMKDALLSANPAIDVSCFAESMLGCDENTKPSRKRQLDSSSADTVVFR